jgi:nardilysin
MSVTCPTVTHVCFSAGRRPADMNNAVMVYVQHGGQTLRDHVISSTCMSFLEEPFFDSLRTEQQLGYDVSIYALAVAKTWGLCASVTGQFPRTPMQKSANAMCEFLNSCVKRLEAVDEDDFRRRCHTLAQQVEAPEPSLGDEASRIWQEILRQTYRFDALDEQARILRSLSHADAVSWLQTAVTTGGRLIVAVSSDPELPEAATLCDGGRVVASPDDVTALTSS